MTLASQSSDTRATLLRRACSGLLDFVYPPLCCHCSARLYESTLICRYCETNIESVDAFELDQEMESVLRSSPIDSFFSMWIFDRGGPLSSVHKLLKYGNRPRIGVTLGNQLGLFYKTLHTLDRHQLVIPVPLYKLRYLERGYNQSERLAHGFCEITGATPANDVIQRTRSTRTQTGLSRQERVDNLEGVFNIVDGNAIKDRHAIVLDDILTTGATVASLARKLDEAGASRISVVTLAFTRPY